MKVHSKFTSCDFVCAILLFQLLQILLQEKHYQLSITQLLSAAIDGKITTFQVFNHPNDQLHDLRDFEETLWIWYFYR